MKTDIQENEVPSTQIEEVLFHLKYIGSLTSYRAIREYGITRLAARIHNLRAEDWNIRSRDIDFTTRHGRKSHYTEYYIE